MKDEGSRRKHHDSEARAMNKITKLTCEISEGKRPDTLTQDIFDVDSFILWGNTSWQ